jgi:hypothetical protein
MKSQVLSCQKLPQTEGDVRYFLIHNDRRIHIPITHPFNLSMR